jgi:hypothetical protein
MKAGKVLKDYNSYKIVGDYVEVDGDVLALDFALQTYPDQKEKLLKQAEKNKGENDLFDRKLTYPTEYEILQKLNKKAHEIFDDLNIKELKGPNVDVKIAARLYGYLFRDFTYDMTMEEPRFGKDKMVEYYENAIKKHKDILINLQIEQKKVTVTKGIKVNQKIKSVKKNIGQLEEKLKESVLKDEDKKITQAIYNRFFYNKGTCYDLENGYDYLLQQVKEYTENKTRIFSYNAVITTPNQLRPHMITILEFEDFNEGIIYGICDSTLGHNYYKNNKDLMLPGFLSIKDNYSKFHENFKVDEIVEFDVLDKMDEKGLLLDNYQELNEEKLEDIEDNLLNKKMFKKEIFEIEELFLEEEKISNYFYKFKKKLYSIKDTIMGRNKSNKYTNKIDNIEKMSYLNMRVDSRETKEVKSSIFEEGVSFIQSKQLSVSPAAMIQTDEEDEELL